MFSPIFVFQKTHKKVKSHFSSSITQFINKNLQLKKYFSQHFPESKKQSLFDQFSFSREREREKTKNCKTIYARVKKMCKDVKLIKSLYTREKLIDLLT